MTYSVSGKIQASDFNWFVDDGVSSSNPENFNKIWSTGAGTYGFGQQTIPTVAYAQKVTAANSPAGGGITQGSADYGGWAALADGITKMASHTGAPITVTPVPIVKNKAAYLTQIATNLTSIHANRLNAASQGGTVATVATSGSTWTDKVTLTFNVDFGTADKARWFFNAGGQLKISADHPIASNINTLVTLLAQSIGDIWISGVNGGTISLSGSTWHGVEKLGGTDPGLVTVFNQDYGFPAWTSTPTTIIRQTTAGYFYDGYGTNSFIEVQVSTNGAGNLTISVTIDEVPLSGTGGATVNAGTTAILVIRPPSSTHLVANWGTPTVTTSVTY